LRSEIPKAETASVLGHEGSARIVDMRSWVDWVGPGYRAALFDCDGLLVETAELWAHGVAERVRAVD